MGVRLNIEIHELHEIHCIYMKSTGKKLKFTTDIP